MIRMDFYTCEEKLPEIGDCVYRVVTNTGDFETITIIVMDQLIDFNVSFATNSRNSEPLLVWQRTYNQWKSTDRWATMLFEIQGEEK